MAILIIPPSAITPVGPQHIGMEASSREIGRIFERFLHFLGQADRAGNPLGRLASAW
jgi:hypothetical protein